MDSVRVWLVDLRYAARSTSDARRVVAFAAAAAMLVAAVAAFIAALLGVVWLIGWALKLAT